MPVMGGPYIWWDQTLGWVITANPGNTSAGGWAMGGTIAAGPCGTYTGFGGHTGQHIVTSSWPAGSGPNQGQNVNNYTGFLKDVLVYCSFGGTGYSTVYFN